MCAARVGRCPPQHFFFPSPTPFLPCTRSASVFSFVLVVLCNFATSKFSRPHEVLVTALVCGTCGKAPAAAFVVSTTYSYVVGGYVCETRKRARAGPRSGSLLVAFSGSARVVPVSTCQPPSLAALGVSKFQSFKLSEFGVSNFQGGKLQSLKFQSFKV